MKDYKNREVYSFENVNGEKIDLSVDEYHFFGCVDKTKSGELVVQSLSIAGAQLFCVAGEHQISHQKLVKMALDWCFDSKTIKKFERYQNALEIVGIVEEDFQVSANINDITRYLSAKHDINRYRDDYYRCCYIKSCESDLRTFLEKCDKNEIEKLALKNQKEKQS